MKEKVSALLEELNKAFADVKSMQDLNDLKVQYQGKKGIITELSAGIKDVPNEEKKEYGMHVNTLRVAFNDAYELNKKRLEEMDYLLSELENKFADESFWYSEIDFVGVAQKK